ncbi:MAG: cytochrome c [Armatimonadota bacterium]|nr:cytochrome c [Armatimonadota bacterium]
MKSHRTIFAVGTGIAGAAVALAALTTPTAPAGAQAGAPNDTAHMKALYQEKCSACHNLPDPVEKGYNRREWQRTVQKMIIKYKATDISPTDEVQIVNFLSTFAPPQGGRNGKRGPLDPWATDADDVWTMAPTTSRVFNFEAPGALSRLTPESAGTPGPAAAWHTVGKPGTPDGVAVKVAPVKPSPTRFALLLDPTDAPRDVDVKVRFQILGGTVSPAVGIAFGLQNSKTYSVLRYDAAKDDLSLLKIAEPTHTTLQTTPITLPVTDATLATAVTPPPAKPAPGWHTLRLLVRGGQIRGWLDMNKRINVADPAYTGGKVGLWTQGDTVATFDDWTVDIYDGAKTAPADTDQ